mmetsp:Transcript_22433/g.50638  ORF Transcript_22433/g.50638 Transcript_22433/m.50638 type:complete len:198 (+) Transcript_22433:81-674(+)|eukprot:CAMPEP_0172615930 /NCGR_PEP_ID=MMETSP1068-20121228/62602_1 /TAXON_ID=35684 /ORGANISM="Pseudopedinella elastica, Strain CCMP716" /LENGTH=197 /DNA_ID=CAMNT_0013421227 /DNA_START=79 /DNA_END=672 /DNA_ORIENTATION=+
MMDTQEEQPAWLQDAPPPPAQQQASSSASMGYKPQSYGSTSEGGSKNNYYLRMAIKTILIGLSVMMAANGVLAFLKLGDSSNVLSDLFVATYICLFAGLLFAREVSEIRPIPQFDDLIRRNFGFLFKPLGKGAFIVFVAFLNFGLTVNGGLGFATGICLAVAGFGYIALYFRKPEIFTAEPPMPKADLPPYVPQQDF